MGILIPESYLFLYDVSIDESVIEVSLFVGAVLYILIASGTADGFVGGLCDK
jgi:hypothetical protein